MPALEGITETVVLSTTVIPMISSLFLIPRIRDGLRSANIKNYYNIRNFMVENIGIFQELDIGRPYNCNTHGKVIPVECDGSWYFLKAKEVDCALTPSELYDASIYQPIGFVDKPSKS
jgi:hypothetical protein